MSIRPQAPAPFLSEEVAERLLALPTPPPSPLSPYSSPLPQIPSPPLPIPSQPPNSPTYVEGSLGSRAAGIRQRDALPSPVHETKMPEICLPLRKRPCRTTPGPGYEVGESLAAGATRQSMDACDQVRSEAYHFGLRSWLSSPEITDCMVADPAGTLLKESCRARATEEPVAVLRLGYDWAQRIGRLDQWFERMKPFFGISNCTGDNQRDGRKQEEGLKTLLVTNQNQQQTKSMNTSRALLQGMVVTRNRMKGLNLYVPSVTSTITVLVYQHAITARSLATWPRTVGAGLQLQITTTTTAITITTTTATTITTTTVTTTTREPKGQIPMPSFALSVGLPATSRRTAPSGRTRTREIATL
ncbi:hypothetical protein Tco_0122823 [Tanacetum coccineum]